MARTVKCCLIQATNAAPTDAPIEEIKRANIEKHLGMIEEAARQGVKILCMQEVFTTPYFCAEQQVRWYEAVEKVPDGPTVRLMQEVARRHGMVIIVPIYEEEETGIYYNTAAVIDADGTYLGKYRKNHIPHTAPGFWEKFYFRDPRGQFLAQAKRDADALVTAELDLEKIREVRHTWQFFRDRRPETY